MKPILRTLPLALTAILLVSAGPAPAASDVVLRIGERSTTLSEFEARATDLLSSGYPHIKTVDKKAREQLLEGVIAQELLIIEGLRRNLPQDPAIGPDLQRVERRALMNAIYDSLALQGDYSSTEAELRTYFVDAQYDVEVLSRHIVCDTEAEGRTVLAELKAGTPFESLVTQYSRRSIQDRFGPGGWVGWFRVGELYDELQEPLTTMTPGQFYPDPIRTSLGYHVFGLQARRPADFEASVEFLRQQLRVQKRANDMEACVNRLRQQYRVHPDDVGMARLAGVPAPDSTYSGPDQTVVTWRGGQLSVADYMRLVQERRAPHPAGASAANLQKAVDNQAGMQVMMAEARRLGLDKLPHVRDKIRDKQLELFGAWFFLNEGKAAARPDTSAANVRRFYDENLDLFTRRDSTVAGFSIVDRSIHNLLVQQAETTAMDTFLAGLRRRYADDISINRKVLQRAAIERPAAPPETEVPGRP